MSNTIMTRKKWVSVIIQMILMKTTVTAFNNCLNDEWVPYRDGTNIAHYSFEACIWLEDGKPSWNSTILKCATKNSSLAYFVNNNELAFYYNSMQNFTQEILTPAYYVTFINLLDQLNTKPEKSYYIRYDSRQDKYHEVPWTFNSQMMIRIQHGKGLQCGIFRMEKDHFAESDIDFVTCKSEDADDEFNRPQSFICRRERAECTIPEKAVFGDDVDRVVGTYVYYYGEIRQQQQTPGREFLANVSTCEYGCNAETEPSGTVYYVGDFLTYWCKTGYRAAEQPSQEEVIITCLTDGSWEVPAPCQTTQFDSCGQAKMMCLNEGILFAKADGSCVCDCPIGWTGNSCHIPVDPCDSNPCMNNGTCKTVENSNKIGYECDCVGTMGTRCEYILNECMSNPCHTGSLCIDLVDGFTCVCLPLVTGMTCDSAIPYCESYNPCSTHAECWSCNLPVFQEWCEEENRTLYVCHCDPSWRGDDCSIQNLDTQKPWEVFAIVLGAMLFIIVSLFCEIIGSRRRHDHDNLQVLLESIDGYLKHHHQDTSEVKSKPNSTRSKRSK